jgi:hypothetical protein
MLSRLMLSAWPILRGQSFRTCNDFWDLGQKVDRHPLGDVAELDLYGETMSRRPRGEQADD